MPEWPKYTPAPWQVPVAVEDVADGGQRFDLVADAQTCAAVARIAGLPELPRLEASFEVTRHGAGGLRVAGRVSATVGQTCVVTLEPLTNEVAEEVALVFAPQSAAKRPAAETNALPAASDEMEPLLDGKIDLGVLATEFLIVGLDPYPRKPGAVFQLPKNMTPAEGPLAAALAAFKKDRQEGSQ
jgi:uncharacterized metal-binding protein YceD (DUF177 family)